MKFLFRPIVALAWRCPCCSPPAATKERNAPRSRNSCRPASSTNPACAVPQLTAEEKSFGDYAAHYAVITDFNSGMDASVKAAEQPDAKGGMRTLSDIVARRDVSEDGADGAQ